MEDLKVKVLKSPISILGNSGFTLIELIVVIFIVSLVLALALPSFTGMSESRVKSEAKKLASLIRYLNDSALSTKEVLQMKVTFNDKTIRYTGSEGEKAEVFDTLSGIELQSKGMIYEGEIIFPFSPMGATESFTAYLTGNGADMTVEFNGMNGRVKILAGNKSQVQSQ
ncbi:MAG TPA: prepilin-type N-terminal cleavage/methylation domain-containing protein [Thermodesulfovibrionales bacterium]|nr:prepilin-type N-terminal cleavage/methylation domain-containing protein [Thermodesulfovibrionales bacterium]